MNSSPDTTPVLFIHGLWLHASSWQPWIDLFAREGYGPVIAPGWPGIPDTVDEARDNPDAVAGLGIDRVVSHYLQIIDALPSKPIIIGHSFGGMIAERFLGLNVPRPPSPSTPHRSRASCRCRSPRCAPRSRSSRTPPTRTEPSR